MNVPFFDYRRQLQVLGKETDNAIRRVLTSGKLILGDEVKKFENNFAEYVGVKYAIGVNSGTDALKIALKAVGIGLNDEVITVANTAVPTISAIRECGAIPKFIDIKRDYNIDENKIEKAITIKTKAILPVHLYGNPCNIGLIVSLAQKYRLKIIEDCAQAHGANIKGKKVGSYGNLGCFSFYPTKNIGAYGDGGIITTSDAKLAQKCRQLRMYGMKENYYAEIEGYNSRLDEIQAAVLNMKLGYLDSWNKKRSRIAKIYFNSINNAKIILPFIDDIDNHVFHIFAVRVKDRGRFSEHLKKNNIGYGIHYPYPIYLQRAYRFLKYTKKQLPLTHLYSKEIISIPIFPELTEKEVHYIIRTINKY